MPCTGNEWGEVYGLGIGRCAAALWAWGCGFEGAVRKGDVLAIRGMGGMVEGTYVCPYVYVIDSMHEVFLPVLFHSNTDALSAAAPSLIA